MQFIQQLSEYLDSYNSQSMERILLLFYSECLRINSNKCIHVNRYKGNFTHRSFRKFRNSSVSDFHSIDRTLH